MEDGEIKYGYNNNCRCRSNGQCIRFPLVHNGHRVNLQGTELDNKVIKNLREGKEHPKHRCKLSDEINTYYVDQLVEALKDTDLIIMGCNSKDI